VKGQLVLFGIFMLIVIVVVLFFTYVPFYTAASHWGQRRNEHNWMDACERYDKRRLQELGLS